MDLAEDEHASDDEDGNIKHDKQMHFKAELNKVSFNFNMENCYVLPDG